MPEPPLPLPETALPAWRAWNALCASKEQYFTRLSALEERRRAGGGASLAEQLHLEQLLKTHTQRTAEFRAAVTALAGKDPAAHAQLVRCLGGGTAAIQ